MWIFAVEGFVSIVQHRERPGMKVVRGRSKTDIQAMASLMSRVTGHLPTVIATSDADYQYRFVAEHRLVVELVRHLVMGIDYPNFKDAVAERQGRHREAVYHEVWSICRKGFALEQVSGSDLRIPAARAKSVTTGTRSVPAQRRKAAKGPRG